jgi:hypothetical protein
MKTLLRLFLLLTLLGVSACGGRYQQNDLEIMSAARAVGMCSCLFVMEAELDFCEVWTTLGPAISTFKVDYEAKTVEVGTLALWGEKARYVGEHFGCELVKP